MADEGEKSFDPTPKRLEDARKKGDIARSSDLNAAAAYLGLLAGIAVFAADGASRSAEILGLIFARVDTLSPHIGGAGGRAAMAGILGVLLAPLAPIFAGPALFTIASVIAQRAIVFAPSKLAAKLSRLSPLENARNKFGINGLVEFAKSFLKLVAVSLVAALVLRAAIARIIGSSSAAPGQMAVLIGDMLTGFLWALFLTSLAIGAADWFWQRHSTHKKQMMSRQEVLDETRDSEGDPHLKQARRQHGLDIATQRMLADVPKADVVIVNPQHYAVALKWSRAEGSAPVCVAKGVDEVAARIRETAEVSGVPIRRDPPTARAVFATVEIGQEIRPEHYRAVAAAIRYAERLTGLGRKGRKT